MPNDRKDKFEPEPAIDFDGFRRQMRANDLEDLIDELIETFLKDAPARFEALEAAINASDPVQIRHAAHAYRSAAATMHALRLVEVLSEIEAAGRADDTIDPVQLLSSLRREHDSVLTQLQATCSSATLRPGEWS